MRKKDTPGKGTKLEGGRAERPTPYDPLDYTNLAGNVVHALIEQPVGPLPPSYEFEGVGVYAIYYLGALEYYRGFTGEERPIYVGCAVPVGKRKGGGAGLTGGRVLWSRLRQHARSIEQAENLRLEDFRCRHLVAVPVWITLAERFLIEHYYPVWNTIVDGFGNHDPGKGRHSMRRPRWDILHPGRPWAKLLKASESPENIMTDLLRRGTL